VSAGGRQARAGRYPGLLEKLMAAVRPEFRAGVLVFDPADPVFGGGTCQVKGCARPGRGGGGLCNTCRRRWIEAGRPAMEGFTAAGPGPRHGHAPLPSGQCRVAGCGFGVRAHGLCSRHLFRWRRAGRPDPGCWAGTQPPPSEARCPGTPSCLISYCQVWAHPGARLCWVHHRRWTQKGRPDLSGFVRAYQAPDDSERIDLTSLPWQLKLELQYALQCRRDDNMIKTPPGVIRAAARVLAASSAASLLALEEPQWRSLSPSGADKSGRRGALLAYARSAVAALAEGPGSWDAEYPRDTWRLRRLGITGRGTANLRFGGIPQPWLKDLAKRWTRWRISTGLSMSACYQGVRAITRFAAFAAHAGIQGLHQADRELLERYLASLHHDLAGNSRAILENVGELNTFLLAIRRHGWDASLPATAMFFPADYPKLGEPLPRALAAHVMAQAEDPANLDRWDNPAYRLITIILIRCGLRISSAVTLPWDCVVTDADGAPYLRYYNTKMKREALVPIDEELRALIGAQHHRIRVRWPAGTPVLFPRPNSNIDGTRPVNGTTYREALRQWLATCDIRDEHGQPVRLTPHQWRHTLGTTLINRDLPQHVVQKILDHDSPQMTALYARLSDKTVREHWEKARKVGATGQPVLIDPGGPLGDAAWAKHQLSRATQALPNGYCQLPAVKTCPHANSCLTCPMFVTTAEFLPQHRAQQQAVLQIVAAAEATGQARLAEMNKQVAVNLDKIITALQDDGSQQETADAS
jgi:integrase